MNAEMMNSFQVRGPSRQPSVCTHTHTHPESPKQAAAYTMSSFIGPLTAAPVPVRLPTVRSSSIQFDPVRSARAVPVLQVGFDECDECAAQCAARIRRNESVRHRRRSVWHRAPCLCSGIHVMLQIKGIHRY